MTVKYRYGQPIAGRLLTLEDPGAPLAFDADRNLIVEVSARHPLPSLIESLQGKREEAVVGALAEWGKAVMETTIELVDGKYIDRTGEMINQVAEQTGLNFPHRFQRYVELSVIASRPLDRWNVSRSTVQEFWFQVFSCSVAKGLADAGAGADGSCQGLCAAAFKVAADRAGTPVRVEQRKFLPRDGACHFCFSPA